VTDGSRLLPVYGSLLELEPRPDSERRFSLMPQAPFAPPEKAYGHRVSRVPAMMITRTNGRPTVRIAWTIGRSLREFGTADIRRVMLDAVHDAVGPAITEGSELPEQLELIMARNDTGLVVHLINVGSARRRGFGPPVPIDGARLHLPADVGSRVRCLVTEGGCRTTVEGAGLVIELPRIDLFEVLTITP
jgi:hypothetical protein